MNKENIRRRIRNVTAFAAALLLAAAFTFPSGTEIMGISFGNAIVASAAQVASGTMSNLIKWELDDAGTLTISYTGSGSGGAMKDWTQIDYYQGKIPWTKYKDNIKSVVIGDKVTSIGDYAFYRCSNITSVDMGSVTSIGKSAFYECTSLSSITIPDSVTSLGGNVFLGCTSLSSVSFGESPKLTSIGIQTFWGCESLTSINIPGSVTSIAIDAFKNCTSLASITVDENSSNYSAESGVLFNKDKTALILYPANKSDTSYAIPSSVSSIGDNAFFDCIGFESISIPESVTSIGVNAFYGCKSLKSVTIPGSVTSIGYGTFIGCTSLSEVTISDGVTSTGVETFKGCTSLSDITIPNSVTSIGDRAFNNCTSLSDITIPGSVASIGGGAFEGCEKLESIAIPDSIDSIENDTFKNCTGLASITIPGSVDSIGDSAFEGCTGLKSITIPNSVTSIGYSAFEGCTGLKSITIPNSVTSIGYGTFIGCTSLSSITIPNSVTSIGDQAFESCSSLESITIPDSVTSIGESAFESCSSLTSITIPDSVNSIGYRTFYKCTSLTSITIPDSVNSIGDLAFYECSSLTSITIPDSVNSIGDFAFDNCTSLESIFLPESLSEIAEYAIPETAAQIKYTVSEDGKITIKSAENGSAMTSVVIPEAIGGKTVTSIGNNALAGCSNLESIIIPKDIDITNAGIPDTTTQIRYTVDNENVTITAVTLGGEATGFVLPDKIGGKAVTNIADGALASCPKVSHEHREKTAATCTEKAVCAICETGYGETLEHTRESHGMCTVCHDGAEECGESAYYQYNDVTNTLTIFGTGSVTKNDWVSEEFSNSAKNIVIESGITDFDNINCFMEVESISYPDTFITINTHVFRDSHSLTSITIDENNENYCAVDNVIFSKDKTKLYCYLRNNTAEKYDIPEGVTSIEERAFNNCKNLKNITIPSGVQNIGDHAFELCINLESITLPSSVKSVGSYAFYDCNNLKTIFIPDGTDVSEAGIPDTTTKVVYSADGIGNASITSIALGTEKTTVNIPETIDGNKVISVAKDYQQYVGDHTHFGGTATCKSKAVCELCGKEYGETGAHSLKKHDAVSASCTTDGNIEYYECNVCGKLFEDENGEKETTREAVTIPAKDHDFGTAWESNDEGHYHVCTGCGEKSDIEAHIQDSGTVTKEATLTENGTITYKCTVCGAKMGEETITATISSFEVTANNVIVYYTVTGSTEVKSQTLNFSEVTEEMVELMKSKDIKLVIDFVNYSTAGSDTIILTAAQMKAIEYVLAHDFVIES